MLREWSWWGLSLVCAFLVWVSIVIAGIIASLLPEAWRLLPAVFPVAVVVLIGLGAADHWWTWGALLSAAPLLAFGVYSLVEALRSTEDTRYHSYAVGFAIAGLGYGLALAVVAVALAALGVIIGQRRNPRGVTSPTWWRMPGRGPRPGQRATIRAATAGATHPYPHPETITIPRTSTAATFVRDRRTWAAYLLLGLFAYIETSIGPVMPFLRAELGLSYAVASLHFAAFAIGAIISGMTGERVVRRVGRTAALWGGIAGMVTGALLIALSPVVVGTILGTFSMGLIGTISLMANQAVLADIHGAQRTIALAESNVTATACAVLAPLIVGTLAASGLGWPLALVLTAPWALGLWLAFRRVRFPDIQPARVTEHGPTTLPKAFWMLAAVLFLVSSVEWCMAYWGAEFLASVVGLEPALAASAMTLFFVAMAGGRLIGSRLAWRIASAHLLYAALVIALVGFLLFWLAPGAALSLVGLFVAGLGIANFYPLTVGVATGAVPELIDTATARLAVAGGSALLLAPLVVGAIADLVGMRWGFGIVAPLLVAAFASLVMAMRMLGMERQPVRLAGPHQRREP